MRIPTFLMKPAVLLVSFLLFPLTAYPATNQNQTNIQTEPSIIKYNRTVPISAMHGRSDNDLVEFASGKRVRLGELRKLDAFSKKLKATPDKHLITGLRQQPSDHPKLTIRSAAELTAALKFNNTDTIQLPSGKRYTVAQLRLAEEMVKKNLGIEPKKRMMKPAEIIQITPKTDWKTVLKTDDNTILQSPNGTRITVLELKKALAAWKPVSKKSEKTIGERKQP